MESKYEILITSHARFRWVERIDSPQKYAHLSVCKLGCETCQILLHSLNEHLRIARKYIDRAILHAYQAAIYQNTRVLDYNFMWAVLKLHGEEEAEHLEFLIYKNAVLVVKKSDAQIPVIKTILSHDMIDGTALQAFRKGKERDDLLKRWKFEDKQRKKK